MRGHIKTNQDWWIAAICIRIEPVGCDVRDGRKRNTTWVNHHLVHAKTLAEAYDKAVVIGRRSEMKYEARPGWMQDRRIRLQELS